MNRNQIVDIAKGIGILFVVFGHNPIVLQPKGELFNVIFSFHMPLFFFLSGIFFKPNKSFVDTFTNKADSLLKPYFTTLLFIGIAFALITSEDIIYYSIGMLYGNGTTIKWVPLWFLTHLFAVLIFSWALVNLFIEKLKTKNHRIYFLVLMLVFGVMFIKYFWQIEINLYGKTYILPGLPFSLDIVFITSSYFLLGHYSSKYVLSFKPTNLIVIISMGLFIGCHYLFDRTIDLNLRVFDGYIIPTIQSLSAIYIILSMSYYAQASHIIRSALSYLGISSIFILIFHSFFQSKAYALAINYYGEKSFISISFAFLAGIIAPVLMWYIVKKSDYLSLFYMPIKSNKTFHRTR